MWGVYKHLLPLVDRIVKSRVRHPQWREDASQEAWIGIIRAVRKYGEISEHLAARITLNACYGVLRRHRRDEDFYPGEILEAIGGMVLPTGTANLELEEFLQSHTGGRREILEAVLAGEDFDNLSELASKTQTSKATCSRTLASLREYLRAMGDARRNAYA